MTNGWWVGFSLFCAFPATLTAQIDYRNLDDDRPVVTEDAYPVERYAFELLLPYRFEDGPRDHQVHAVIPEITYGLMRNTQLGAKVAVSAVHEGAETDWGFAGVRVFGLYNLNTETSWLPALSIRGDVGFPLGSLAGNDTRYAVKAIATRSWGKYRVHLNAARGFGPEGGDDAGEPISRWSGSAALDRTFYRQSFLLLTELAASQDVESGPTAVNISIGGRWQWTPTMVIDLGLTRRLKSIIGPDLGFTIGFSHGFAIGGLMPSGR